MTDRDDDYGDWLHEQRRDERLNNEPRPAWLDIACPGCGEIHFAQSDECHECECGAMFYIPRFDEPQYIGPAWGEESA